jgi:Ca2+-transporting ATPase
VRRWEADTPLAVRGNRISFTVMNPSHDTPPKPSPNPTRPRAPTITIDESAITGSPEPPKTPPSERPFFLPRLQTDGLETQPRLSSTFTASPTDTRAPPADRASRPTSPHNVSSPTHHFLDGAAAQNFLTVPGARSRGNSIESDVGESSISSLGGDTYIPSSTTETEDATSRRGSNTDDNVMDDEEALRPDPGTEADFEVEDNKFAFSPGQLNKLINPKSFAAFHALGGLVGLEKGLRTNRQSGLSLDEVGLDGTVSFEEAVKASHEEFGPVKRTKTSGSMVSRAVTSENAFSDRKRIFKDNKLPEKKTKTIWQLAWIAYNDKVLILLTVAAVVSLALGIYQTISPNPQEMGAHVEWVEGVTIVAAILIVVIVGALNDFQKERQFVKLNKKKEERFVKVIRSGKSQEVSVYDVLVGDVMHLEPGDLVPVDGIFIDGHNVKFDESSVTGESDIIRKTPADDVYRAIENHEPLRKMDPFILSGGKMSEGVGVFLVTSVGVNSSYGKTLMSLQDEGQTTPLQSKLNVLAEYIAKLGLAAGLLLFIVSFIEFLARLHNISDGSRAKGQAFLQVFIVAVTIVVVAVPEGLPLAVTLALAFATTRMLKDNNLVRLLRACETMGNATTVCSDKTGTLTENKMSVVAGTVGTTSRFGDKQALGGAKGTANGRMATSSLTKDSDISSAEFVSTLSKDTKDLIKDSIVLNSTAFESEENGKVIFIGSKTETSLLTFANDHLGIGSVSEERANADIVEMVPFDSGRKCMAVVIKLANGKYRMLVKGASEILIARCTNIIGDPTRGIAEMSLTPENVETLNSVVSNYASRSLRTIAFLYKNYEQWPPRGAPMQREDPQSVDFNKIFKEMVFLGVVGIQDPLRQGVTEAVHQCQGAGVFVRMVTGDNIMTAKAIASECGIYTAGGIAMEGPVFRKLGQKQLLQIIPRLQVLARSSPEDKKLLVKELKKQGETVAVTGDGTNDAAALKAADVGFSMGIAGTEVAKEASDIILMDDNFASIVKAISWGRAVNDAVKKFLQVSDQAWPISRFLTRN